MSDYPYTIRPIDRWPGERRKPRISNFHAAFAQDRVTVREGKTNRALSTCPQPITDEAIEAIRLDERLAQGLRR